MKYKFEFPFTEKKTHVIAHRIFLSKEQRKDLLTKEVIATGVCIPAVVEDDETIQEVFCHYKLYCSTKTEIKDCTIQLSFSDVESLQDIRDFRKNPGAEFVSFYYHDIIEINKLKYPVIHQVVISDINVLEDSMDFVHLSHVSSK